MSSCNNSSNIAGNLTINSLQAVGSRLITVIPNTNTIKGGVQSGVTAGDVLRYDVITEPNIYVKAQANDPATSEVVGVVESVNDNDVYLVLSGQMKFPTGAFAKIDPDGPEGPQGSTGGAGGNDIYFLSSATGGLLQNIAPNQPTEIVKPVLQMADNGDYNAVVQNYIGYQVGGNVVASEEDGSGNDDTLKIASFIDNGSEFLGGGFIRADKSHVLDPFTYSNFYKKVGIQYGHVVRIKIDNQKNSSVSASVSNRQAAYQMKTGNVTISGNIRYISPDEIEVDVKDHGNDTFSTDSKLYISGKSYGNPVSVELIGIRTPIITNPSNGFVLKTDNGQIVPNSVIYGLKISSTIGVTIPDTVSVTNLEVTNKLSAVSTDKGKTITDVVALIDNLNTDNKDSRSKLNTSATDNTAYISTTS
tara:strand:- start:683 stop:1936 length:1254 start_codon:yes stop_codon:yes gene_type:complete